MYITYTYSPISLHYTLSFNCKILQYCNILQHIATFVGSVAVFDLSSGNVLGHLLTSVSGNLSIVCLRQTSKLGTPVPDRELLGHTSSVSFLIADDKNERLFSGGHDGCICVWWKNKKLNDFMQIQTITSVHKSSRFTCMALMPNLQCIAAGTASGHVGIWHEEIYEGVLESDATSYESGFLQALTVTQQMIESKHLLLGKEKQKEAHSKVTKWRCVHTWKAHANGKVAHMFYDEKNNTLTTCGDDGCVRIVYVCHPALFPNTQVVPKDAVAETQDLSLVAINCSRLTAEDYSLPVRSRLRPVFEEIEHLHKIHFKDAKKTLISQHIILFFPKISNHVDCFKKLLSKKLRMF
ncbi:hypothetical protein RFI_27200 [Reticulomyxa filosa]|uniref:Uncharacterized protein n=1 Tax=Reticulomyxa filosa TaxID=46433 RepID=X6M863_RETFI|nr:hypothetical protein RFI_27200 [Reticulomyxa filosa]|eukprot:ETO10173.1 hypothetical protein RFI_27200 [Reticulomyxa filosa]